MNVFAFTGLFSISSSFSLFSLSLSANGFSLNSGYTLDTNAMCVPSGDQMPLPAPVLMVVSCFGSPPARR